MQFKYIKEFLFQETPYIPRDTPSQSIRQCLLRGAILLRRNVYRDLSRAAGDTISRQFRRCYSLSRAFPPSVAGTKLKCPRTLVVQIRQNQLFGIKYGVKMNPKWIALENQSQRV